MSGRPAMIFAAGLGTRMRPLTLSLPKPLIQVAGSTLLDRAVAIAREAGVRRIVINVHYLADMIRNHLAGQTDICFSDESAHILDTGGGLKAAISLLGDTEAFTLNPDAAWTGRNPLRELSDTWDRSSSDGLLLLIPMASALGHDGQGDFDLDPDGRIRRGGSFVYSGAQILRLAAVAETPGTEFSLNVVWDRLIAKGRLHGIVHDGTWCDVGRPENMALAEAMLRDE